MPKLKVTYGGWYQRTTLHLSEIYEFLKSGASNLPLDQNNLKQLQKPLNITQITRKLSYLEYIEAYTSDDIKIRYYEDGLYVLEIATDDIEKAQKKLETYFNESFNPAINYIFSLGAPTPKILANIKTKHPTVVTLPASDLNNFQLDQNKFGDMYSQLVSDPLGVFKTREFIIIVYDPAANIQTEDLVEAQIFFREFKDQLEKYLFIHRKVWEEIAAIKERKTVKPKEIPVIRKRLDSYQRTINLISNRINQMGAYIRTRQSVSKRLGLDEHLLNLFQYRFEVLIDTLDYIKEIWKMTTDYVNNAIQIVVEIQNQSTNKSIQSLTFITTIGVVAGLIGHLSRDSYPKVTNIGVMYLLGLLLGAFMINKGVQKIYLNMSQKLKFTDRDENI